jgi:hypothetical protein
MRLRISARRTREDGAVLRLRLAAAVPPSAGLIPHSSRHAARNTVSSQVSERSLWRTTYVSPSAPRSLK